MTEKYEYFLNLPVKDKFFNYAPDDWKEGEEPETIQCKDALGDTVYPIRINGIHGVCLVKRNYSTQLWLCSCKR